MQGKNDILAGEDRIQFDFDSILRDSGGLLSLQL